MGEINPRQLDKFKQALEKFPRRKARQAPVFTHRQQPRRMMARLLVPKKPTTLHSDKRTADAPMADREIGAGGVEGIR